VVAPKAVRAFGHAGRDPAHLAREVVIRVRTLHAARAGASAKASRRIGNLAAGSNLPPKHGALILWSLGLRNDGALGLLSFVLDFRRAIRTDSARTWGGGGDTRRNRRGGRLRLRRAGHLGRWSLGSHYEGWAM
jgi:hypothetical protein